MDQRRKVVVTGACGRMAGLLLSAFRQRYDLTLLDIRTTDAAGQEVEGVDLVDLLDRKRDALCAAFRGADAVVHCGFVRVDEDSATPEERFFAELANVEMAFNVYQSAWDAQVPRVVVASSNHAADYYEPLILDHEYDFVDPNGRALSDNYYGWAKATYEHLGFVFAAGRANGRPLENVQIRIGGPRETDVARCQKGDIRCMRRALAAYMSQRDMVQLFVKSIEAEDILDGHGVPFQIFYGISDNPHAFWSIANARRVIGYAPQDNSEIRFRELIAEHIAASLRDSGGS